MRHLLAAVLVLYALFSPTSTTHAADTPCHFQLGFLALHDLAPGEVGDCLEDEGHNPENGDGLQHTTKGLMAWRKADNWTAFTNGYWTWINGPYGLAKRLNTQRYSWEANPEGLPAADATAASRPPATHAGPPAAYPNSTLTPGDVLVGVTAAQVCTPGYATGVRDVTTAEKAVVYSRYGVSPVFGEHEVDHFIPLELGGSNVVTNLWPEPYVPVPGAHEKDRAEYYLHYQVCAGTMTLQQAQDAIRTDWYAVYLQIPSRTAPPSSTTSGHTYYASIYPGANTIYCDTDGNWRTLSPSYLKSYPSLEAAMAALPGYHLRQPC